MDVQLQARRVGAHHHRAQIVERIEQEAALIRGIRERLQHGCRMRPKGPVHEAFDATGPKPPVSAAIPLDVFGEPLPFSERRHGIDARHQVAARFYAAIRIKGHPALIRILQHVVHGRDAVRRHVLHRGSQIALELPFRRRRDRLLHKLHGVVLQDARRPAVIVTDDLAPGDVRRIRIDTRLLQCERIRERHVSVEAEYPQRVLGGDSVDPVAARQLAAPERVIPGAAEDPLPRFDGLRKCLDASGELRGRLCIPQLHRRDGCAAGEEVYMRVDEPRQQHAAVRLDDLGASADQGRDFRGGADGENFLARYGNGLGPRPSRIAGPDARAGDDERGGRCFR